MCQLWVHVKEHKRVSLSIYAVVFTRMSEVVQARHNITSACEGEREIGRGFFKNYSQISFYLFATLYF